MDALLQFISKNESYLLLLSLTCTVVLIVLLASVLKRLGFLQSKWKSLFSDASGSNIEMLLNNHLRNQIQTQESIDLIKDRLRALESDSVHSKRRQGVVKFDAFPDVGGSQSFAIALIDDQGSGFILSSLVGRSDCRVYCKAVNSSKVAVGLSGEEEQALKSAVSAIPGKK